MDIYITIAKAAKDQSLLEQLASSAMEEQAKAIGQGVNTMDPRWAAPAIAEAWCYAKISVSKGYLDRLHSRDLIARVGNDREKLDRNIDWGLSFLGFGNISFKPRRS